MKCIKTAALILLPMLAFGAWYDSPVVKTTIDINSEFGSNQISFINLSEDGKYLMANLHTDNDAYPVQLYAVETLLAAPNWTVSSSVRLGQVFAKDTYGTKWKGGAISSVLGLMIPGCGQTSVDAWTQLAVPASSWTKDVNAFSISGLMTSGSDGMDFNAAGTRLYCNSSVSKGTIYEYDVTGLAAGHSVSAGRTINSGVTRVRNLSCYAIGGHDLLFYGEGDSSTNPKPVYVVDLSEQTPTPVKLLDGSAFTGDIVNVKVSGTFVGKPKLYVATDNGPLYVYSLAADGKSLFSKTPTHSFTAAQVSALCGLNGFVASDNFRNFEVTDDGRYAFFAHQSNGGLSAPGICVVYTENDMSIAPVEGDANAVTTLNGNRTVITVSKSGKVRVNEPCEVELLVVGGGGGGGGVWSSDSDKSRRGGGGGGGGVIHKMQQVLSAGEYQILIGAGGSPNRNWDGTVGGDTTAFGLTAKGGGYGAMANGRNGGTDGASGGGGSKDGNGTVQYCGKAKYTGAPYYNLGHDASATPTVYNGCGGGGAGSAGGEGGQGGDGYLCKITGENVYYAGGGGGNGKATAGKGADAEHYGGGGSAGQNGYVGGDGVVIISYANGYKEVFNDAIGGLKKKGHDAKGAFFTHTFTTDGAFTMPHAGLVEVLVVGGGGGGGGPRPQDVTDTSIRSGGGGGGGVVHKTEMILSAGEYAIKIGKGGLVLNNWNTETAQGGDTTAFGIIAKGGGYGGMGNNITGGNNGASGGGNSKDASGTTGWVGQASYTGSPYFNLGNNAGTAQGKYSGGGGGGGAGTAGNGIKGGDGYLCKITGADVYYAGGGGGNADDTNGKGGGNTCYGGGGRQNRTGGDGVVIVRYAREPNGMLLLVR